VLLTSKTVPTRTAKDGAVAVNPPGVELLA
jgi:hypothetical protein